MTRLGDVCAIRYGKDHKKLSDGSIPTYGSGGIMRYVDTAICEQPSVLIPRKGTLGNLFYTDEPFWTVDTLFWTDIDQTKIVPKYLYYQLKQKDLASYNVGTAVPSLTVEVLNEIDLDVPSIDKQRRIVEVLNSFDSKIALNNQLNDYLEQLVDGKFQELFGGLNFNATLSDVAEITMGQSPAGSSYNEEGAGIIFYQGRGEFGWRFPKRRLYTTEPKRLACEGDVLMSVRAPVGDLNVAFENCCIGRGLAAIHSETPSFALYLMRFLKPQLEAYNGEGTVFGSINGKALKSLEVALPSHNEVMQFESFAAPIDALIRSNENETRKLNNLRNYLLPKLMSGEIDVSKVDLTQLTNNHLVDC
ncbi:restriction endonuclease subunit S [Bifidobacterium longum]|nr:restriction endonuclease subunit S [Bifidobacterium longum]KAB7029323.1 restriction endonuclease subunit S [Bifidobacterium longum]KAB7044638.1 restriction endonuclease subunit S [Bifidobacterium longum]KAB7045869.1 restriction endonuclease subunit S [Bifidobacterium longum]KAB7047985.1 restriction endonuclease subunit S [Bifidobacterium longum]